MSLWILGEKQICEGIVLVRYYVMICQNLTQNKTTNRKVMAIPNFASTNLALSG